MLAIAIRDHHGKAHPLRDPATLAVAAFAPDRAWAVARHLVRSGADVHGLFAAPSGSRLIRSADYARHVASVALQDARKLQHR